MVRRGQAVTRSPSRPALVCYRCGQSGHMRNQCSAGKVHCNKCDNNNHATKACGLGRQRSKSTNKGARGKSKSRGKSKNPGKGEKKKAEGKKAKGDKKMSFRAKLRAAMTDLDTTSDEDSSSDESSEPEGCGRMVARRCEYQCNRTELKDTPRLSCTVRKPNSRRRHPVQACPDTGATKSIMGLSLARSMSIRAPDPTQSR